MNIRKIGVSALAAAVVALAGAGMATATAVNGTPSNYTALTATRLVDTRIGLGVPKAPVAADATLVVTLPGVPAGATAVTLNVTVTAPAAAGVLVAYPDGGSAPAASNLNWATGQTIANAVTVPVTDGKVDLANRSGGSTQLVVDLEGYYTAAAVVGIATTKDLGAVASVTTGGGFVDNATPVGSVQLPAGTYTVTLSAKATALLTTDVQVFPQFFIYDQVKNVDFTGDLLNIGSGALESGGNTNIDSYYDGAGLVTLADTTTLDVYAFGYDSDRGVGSYKLDDLTITAIQVQPSS